MFSLPSHPLLFDPIKTYNWYLNYFTNLNIDSLSHLYNHCGVGNLSLRMPPPLLTIVMCTATSLHPAYFVKRSLYEAKAGVNLKKSVSKCQSKCGTPPPMHGCIILTDQSIYNIEALENLITSFRVIRAAVASLC